MEFIIKPEIDLGNLLTLLTIIGGLFAWLITQSKTRAREKLQQAKNGSLRMILRLLRERNARIVLVNDLYSQFQDPDHNKMRKEYCGMNYKFKAFHQFEAALYTLDNEGKIRYAGGDEILYLHNEKIEQGKFDSQTIELSNKDTKNIINTFNEGFDNTMINTWELKNITSIAYGLCPDEIKDFLIKKLDDKDWHIKSRAVELIETIGVSSINKQAVQQNTTADPV